MSRVRSLLKFGRWPESRAAPVIATGGLSDAARRQADQALVELQAAGVSVSLDQEGRARFKAGRIPSRAAQRLIETRGDQIEKRLAELRDGAG